MHYLRLLAATAAFASLVGCTDDSPTTPAGEAPLLTHSTESARIPDRYIVVFSANVHDAPGLAERLVREHQGTLYHTYEHTIRGFAARLSAAAVQALRRNPNVEYVAEDGWVELALSTQSNATWGLDRIDQHDLPLNASYRYRSTGQGVRAYVIDTGIRTSHSEFGGRASVGADFVGDGQNGQDCNGHGTHVAGTIGGQIYGVAKAARLISVRVFDCYGTPAPSSRIIAAVDWVTANAQKPAVVNMSLAGGYYAPTNDALQASISRGITYVVGAGNDTTDACTKSPASTPAAITVGATTSSDTRSPFSNWGTCVDVFAPGSAITSAWWGSDIQTVTISGTSMATPHVAGVAALYLERDPTASPAIVHEAITKNATVGRLYDVGPGSPNRLVRAPLRIAIHRTYSHPLTDHMYGHDPLEGASLGYVLEGRNYFFLTDSPTVDDAELYRCFNSAVHDHFLTLDPNCEGRSRDASLGRIATRQLPGTVPLYRLVDPTTWDHFYTTSYSERQSAMNAGWREEGTTGYVFTEW